jgi:integrase
MAALQERNGSYRVIFWYHGKQESFTIGDVSETEANATLAIVENLLRGIRKKQIHIPAETDIVSFLCKRLANLNRESDNTPEPEPQPRNETTLGVLRDRYIATHSNGTIEKNSLDTVSLHFSHFCRSLGDGFPLNEMSHLRLQEYINSRSRKGISPVTIRKELASIRAAWNWGKNVDLTSGQFPTKDLRYPKPEEKPDFKTRSEIEGTGNHINSNDKAWECLYLQLPEIEELLCYVKANASHPFIYPMIAFAAYTGARRSEMLRVLITNVEFDRNSVVIVEKKRTKGKVTRRRVPLTEKLAVILQEWLTIHPGGQYLFCLGSEVARSKKRSKTTGHAGMKTRASSLKGRLAGVKARGERPEVGALTKNEAHDHFKRTLAGSKWEVLRGFHVLRHSFISACASKGVDQRLIDEWVGHTTEEMRKRYRHLYPSTQRDALNSVFG